MKLRPPKSATLSLFDEMQMRPEDARSQLRVWLDPEEPFGDNFSGGGGVRVGISAALEDLGITDRRAQDVAVNHWPGALAMYRANHPLCRTYCEDIAKVDPVAASGGRRYAFAWFSPTCIFFSQAKGGPLDESATKVRGLAWLAVSWAASRARPRVLCLENVKPFMKWGPLHRQHSCGCSEETASENGRADAIRRRKNPDKAKPKCLKGCNYLRPIKARIGTLFNAFINKLRRYYRYVDFRVLKAHHYGAPTSRERFFLVASDEPMEWPTPTHGPGRKPYRTAAECIDWSIECPSIFERARELAEKTLARIRTGIEKFVFGSARPFIVPTSYGDKGGSDVRVSSVDEPLRTIAGNRSGLAAVSPTVLKAKTYGGGGNDAKSVGEPLGTVTTSKRGEHAIATPYVVPRGFGERPDQDPRVFSAERPLSTIVAEGEKHGIAMPVLVKNYSERKGGFAGGQRIDAPAGAITARDHHALSAVHMTKLRGTSDDHIDASAQDIATPVDTISADGTHHAMTAAYLLRYNGQSTAANANVPLSTIDTKDRFAVVQLELERTVCERALRVAKFLGYDAPIVLAIDGVEWVLVDIGFRMLTPRELFRCQGFPDDYVIDADLDGKPLTKTAQIKCVGNSVPPPLAKAVVIAALRTVRYEPEMRRAA